MKGFPWRLGRTAALAGALVAAGLALSFSGGRTDDLRGVDGSSGQAGNVDWPAYLGDVGSSQYSGLDQITPNNVSRLEVAWEYRTGDARDDNRSQIQCNPLVIDGVVYGTSPQIKVFALDADTGRERWVFNPFGAGAQEHSLGVNRGLMYWEDGDDRRIFVGAGSRLFALDADTGTPVPSFGSNGSVSLHLGLGERSEGRFVLANTPGVIYKNLLILGTRVSENADAAPGHLRAFDVRTGELVWTFFTVPRPGEYGHHTWPEDAWGRIGGANSWAGMSLDRERGVVYIPTGSAAYDFYGGNRHGANLFGNSILALDAATGERVWHYQVVHHDLWDRDLPAPPNLVTVIRDGRRIDAVAQITKSGHVFVLDRELGQPLFPVVERPFPPSDLRGEEAWPTQPLPLIPPPFARQEFREEDVTDISPEAHGAVLARFRQVRSGGQFVPPSLEGTMIFPGFDGGGEWGGAAFDSSTGILYVNSNEMPWILTMVDVDPPQEVGTSAPLGERLFLLNCAACHGANREGNVAAGFPPLLDLHERLEPQEVLDLLHSGRGVMPSFQQLSEQEQDALVAFLFELEVEEGEARGEGMPASMALDVPYAHTGWIRFLDPDGYPAVKPPWGTLNAIDLNAGEILWSVPLGEFPELTERGIPRTGTENYGGPVVTAGGLIFIAASKDEHIRAFDKATGEELWKHKLPAGGYATPATYTVDGTQYVVIAAGGGKMETKSGDAYVAFRLRSDG